MYSVPYAQNCFTNSKTTLLPTDHECATIAGTACSHPGTGTDSRCFFLWFGRTVLSSSASAGTLAETHTGRYAAPNPATVVDAGTGTGGDVNSDACTFHDRPSRSVNSVFTPTNERRSSAHCACGGWCVSQSFCCVCMVWGREGHGGDGGMTEVVVHGWVAHRCRDERRLVLAVLRGFVRT